MAPPAESLSVRCKTEAMVVSGRNRHRVTKSNWRTCFTCVIVPPSNNSTNLKYDGCRSNTKTIRSGQTDGEVADGHWSSLDQPGLRIDGQSRRQSICSIRNGAVISPDLVFERLTSGDQRS